ncbi:MAG: hypothetical protein WDM76_07720 [Limisphaerales bacterium]
MNSMNDEHFFDLAMKVIAHQCTDAEARGVGRVAGTRAGIEDGVYAITG